MLDGRKKFARMGEEYPPEEHYNESYFDKYVLAGVLHREVVLKPFSKPFKMKDGREFYGIREVYYTLIGEEWRIPAWKLIAKASQKTGWNESFERLEGMLFGYEEWQMDWWIARYKKPPPIQSLAGFPSLA